MSEATMQQKIIDLRTELIKKRIKQDKQLQVINLQAQRMANLESALKAIMEKTKESKAYSEGAYIYRIAHKAIHSE